MDANARECGVKILIGSDSRLFALIRGFRINNHAARTFAESEIVEREVHEMPADLAIEQPEP